MCYSLAWRFLFCVAFGSLFNRYSDNFHLAGSCPPLALHGLGVNSVAATVSVFDVRLTGSTQIQFDEKIWYISCG